MFCTLLGLKFTVQDTNPGRDHFQPPGWVFDTLVQLQLQEPFVDPCGLAKGVPWFGQVPGWPASKVVVFFWPKTGHNSRWFPKTVVIIIACYTQSFSQQDIPTKKYPNLIVTVKILSCCPFQPIKPINNPWYHNHIMCSYPSWCQGRPCPAVRICRWFKAWRRKRGVSGDGKGWSYLIVIIHI